MDLSEKLHRSVKIDTWISLSSLMNLSMDLIKLLHGFVKVVLCISRPLPNKIMPKFDQDFQAC